MPWDFRITGLGRVAFSSAHKLQHFRCNHHPQTISYRSSINSRNMPPKKRTKTTHSDGNASASKAPAKGNRHATSVARSRNIRGRRGGLQDMPKMPLDVLFEVLFK